MLTTSSDFIIIDATDFFEYLPTLYTRGHSYKFYTRYLQELIWGRDESGL